jgi:5-formyltetrahydrofolate cyclo-ligase
MSTSLSEAKAVLRGQIRDRLKLITPEQRVVESARICARLQASPLWQTAGSVMLFASLPDEPDVWPLLELALRENKVTALPGFDPDRKVYLARRVTEPPADMQPGRFGIREPAAHCPSVPLNRLDLILVPGVAFDSGGRRLGRGKGFYDRLLMTAGGVTCGVAYDEQLVAEVPAAPHDITLNRILTPTRWC